MLSCPIVSLDKLSILDKDHLFKKTVSVRKAKKTTPPFGVGLCVPLCVPLRWTFVFLDISYTFQVAAKKIESQNFFF